ncbi:unnamed protein product [Chrysoparadoxa australica]
MALVTGGGSGLGAAVVRRLVASKWPVVIADLTNKSGVEGAKNASFVPTDVTKENDVREALRILKDETGKEVSVVVNCAGIGHAARTLSRDGISHDLEEFQRVLQSNTVGTFNVLRLAAERMATRSPDSNGQRGVIINTASIAAYEGQVGQAAYAASKAAIVGLTLPCARDLAGKSLGIGVRVCAVAPGLFKTPLLEALPKEAQEALAATIPNPSRLGDPDEFAQLVESMIANPMLNGEVIRLDGALRMGP